MKEKLSIFTKFANSLYPNEVDYLSKVQNFKDPDNRKILEKIIYNSEHINKPIDFDTRIDKRKYSKLKKWIIQQLNKIDVDYFFDRLNQFDKKINTDNVLAEDEEEILKMLTFIKPTSYYFTRFYELLENFKDYLLIRMRYHFFEQVNSFLNTYRSNYRNAVKIQRELHEISEKLIYPNTQEKIIHKEYAQKLEKIIQNEKLDGFIRYRAFIRLSYYHYRISNFYELKKVYVYLDKQFEKNLFYSKRILANYYANRALMHVKLNEFDEAEYYGSLSIRQKNADYIFYLNNFSNILLKKGKFDLALEYQTKTIQDVNKTNNFYHKIGFTSMYIKTLTKNRFYTKAINYGKSFLDVYHSEIFDFRWYLFFTSYIEALFYAEKYDNIIYLCKRYNLVERENKLSVSKNQASKLDWYNTLSKYMTNSISEKKCIEYLLNNIEEKSLLSKDGKLSIILKSLSESLYRKVICDPLQKSINH
jgi:hypothetical protein